VGCFENSLEIVARRHEVTLAVAGQLARRTLGLSGALALTQVLARFLYGVTASDPMTYLVAAVTMLVISVAASGLPAHRAMNADR
jgi:hypothetical protein